MKTHESSGSVALSASAPCSVGAQISSDRGMAIAADRFESQKQPAHEACTHEGSTWRWCSRSGDAIAVRDLNSALDCASV